MIRIAVFDDNRDRCESLSMIIQNTEDMQLVGLFNDALNALSDVKSCTPDVILMDIQMPGINGIEAVKLIKSEFPGISILMQTVFFDDKNIFDSIKAGASGYILKHSTPEKIIESIRDVRDGGSPMSPSIARRVLEFFQQPVINNDYNLSKRESEILLLLTKGKSYKMIAETCHISFATVNTHIRSIYSKLHVNSIGQAVAKALRQQIV